MSSVCLPGAGVKSSDIVAAAPEGPVVSVRRERLEDSLGGVVVCV